MAKVYQLPLYGRSQQNYNWPGASAAVREEQAGDILGESVAS